MVILKHIQRCNHIHKIHTYIKIDKYIYKCIYIYTHVNSYMYASVYVYTLKRAVDSYVYTHTGTSVDGCVVLRGHAHVFI